MTKASCVRCRKPTTLCRPFAAHASWHQVWREQYLYHARGTSGVHSDSMDQERQTTIGFRAAGLSPAGGICSASVSPELPITDSHRGKRAQSLVQWREVNSAGAAAERQGTHPCSALREEAGGSFIPHDQLTFVRLGQDKTPPLESNPSHAPSTGDAIFEPCGGHYRALVSRQPLL